MSLEKIEQAVLAEAEAAAAHVINDARRAQEDVLARWKADCDAAFRSAVAEAEAAAARDVSRQTSSARHKWRMENLAARNAVIDEVFRRAAEALRAIPNEEYLAMLEAWLLALPADASGTLRVAVRDVDRLKGAFIDRVNSQRGQGGRFDGPAADNSVGAGFVLDAGEYVIRETVEGRLAALRLSMAGELAADLFGDKG